MYSGNGKLRWRSVEWAFIFVSVRMHRCIPRYPPVSPKFYVSSSQPPYQYCDSKFPSEPTYLIFQDSTPLYFWELNRGTHYHRGIRNHEHTPEVWGWSEWLGVGSSPCRSPRRQSDTCCHSGWGLGTLMMSPLPPDGTHSWSTSRSSNLQN